MKSFSHIISCVGLLPIFKGSCSNLGPIYTDCPERELRISSAVSGKLLDSTLK